MQRFIVIVAVVLVLLPLSLAAPKVNALDFIGKNCTSANDCSEHFMCRNGTCHTCVVDSDCFNYPAYLCSNSSDGYHRCNFKSLFPMNVYEITSTVIIFFINLFASCSGIGGGTVFVPILLLLGKLPTRYAVATGMAVVMGSAVASVCVLLFMYHPFRKNGTPLVSYELVALLEPTLLAGTAVGVLLNASFPPWLIQVLLAIILIFIIFRTCTYMIPFIRKCFPKKDKAPDNGATTAAELPTPPSTPAEQPISPTSTVNPEQAPANIELKMDPSKTEQFTTVDMADQGADIHASRSIDNLLTTNNGDNNNQKLEQKPEQPKELVGEFMQHEATQVFNDEEIEKIEEKTTKAPTPVGVKKYLYRLKRRFPLHKISVPTVSLLIIFLDALFKGNNNMESIFGLPNCSGGYWGIFVAQFPLLFILGYGYGLIEKFAKYRNVLKDPTHVSNSDFKYTWPRLIIIPILLFFVGILVSLLGTGAGTFLGPIFVSMNIPPEVGTATSGFMMIYSSSSTCIQYLLTGKLKWDYGLWFGGAGLVSAIFGQLVIRWIVNRLKIGWLLILIMIIVLGASLILLIPMLVIRVQADFFQAGGQTGFASPCTS